MTLLLEIEDARIDQDGVPLIEGLTLRAEGNRAGFVGDASGLFALLGGSAELSAGRLLVAGRDAKGALAAGVVGLARRDPLLPESWDAERYLIEGARLGGLGRRAAADSVRSLLAGLGLAHLAGRRIATLTLTEKRAVALALALTDAPAVLAVEDPVSDLDARGVGELCSLIERAAADRALIVSTSALPRVGPEHALFARAEQVFLIEAGSLVGQGNLEALTQPGRRYLVSVSRRGKELAERLSAAGLPVAPARASSAVIGEGARFLVSLPEAGGTLPIVEAALAAGAPIVELVPLREKEGASA